MDVLQSKAKFKLLCDTNAASKDANLINYLKKKDKYRTKLQTLQQERMKLRKEEEAGLDDITVKQMIKLNIWIVPA